jgi:hypothetical protein
MGCIQSSKPPTNGTISQPRPPTQSDGTSGVPLQGEQRPTRVSVNSYNGSLHTQGLQSPLPPVPELPPGPPADLGKVFIARYAYQARTSEDLSFEKGEQLTVSYSNQHRIA